MINFKKSVSMFVVMLMVLALGMQVMAAQKASGASKSSLVNINTADKAGLTRLPRVGEKIQFSGLVFTVVAVDNRRIKRIRIFVKSSTII